MLYDTYDAYAFAGADQYYGDDHQPLDCFGGEHSLNLAEVRNSLPRDGLWVEMNNCRTGRAAERSRSNDGDRHAAMTYITSVSGRERPV